MAHRAQRRVSTPTKPGGCVTMRLPVLFAQGHLDPGVMTISQGCRSTVLGVGLYAPECVRSPDAPVKRVIVFRKGYYGEH
jgi:hypothetical protein